jgi:hypothetical protein
VNTWFLEAHHVTYSISAAGSYAEKAGAESFFDVLDCGQMNRLCRTRVEARADIMDYIDWWHNSHQRQRLAMQEQTEQFLAQLSVISIRTLS